MTAGAQIKALIQSLRDLVPNHEWTLGQIDAAADMAAQLADAAVATAKAQMPPYNALYHPPEPPALSTHVTDNPANYSVLYGVKVNFMGKTLAVQHAMSQQQHHSAGKSDLIYAVINHLATKLGDAIADELKPAIAHGLSINGQATAAYHPPPSFKGWDMSSGPDYTSFGVVNATQAMQMAKVDIAGMPYNYDTAQLAHLSDALAFNKDFFAIPTHANCKSAAIPFPTDVPKKKARKK